MVRKEEPLPANNIAQQLFQKNLPSCNHNHHPCCNRNIQLKKWYEKAPKNLWNTATNYQGGPPFDSCTDKAFEKQCFLSQYFNYLSKNNNV